MQSQNIFRVAIVGGGPAGLMAAQALAQAPGLRVDVYDAMPSVGRKFLLAGRGGMNITHAEPYDTFVTRYGRGTAPLRPMLDAFGPQQVRDWVHGLGIETFVGTSGRVFPTGMKAAPLLRAWLHRLREQGVRFHQRHRWQGWGEDGIGSGQAPCRQSGSVLPGMPADPQADAVSANGAGAKLAAPSPPLLFDTPEGALAVQADATILALGGASWARLGSDGAWVPLLRQQGIEVAPLLPANCGFDVRWSAHFSEKYAGQPLTTVAIQSTGADGQPLRKQGQFVVTAGGVEGSLIYALSAALRDQIMAGGSALIHLDLLPDLDHARVLGELGRPRGARSMASHLQSRLGIKGVKAGLLRECASAGEYADPARLAHALKKLPLRLHAPRPIDEAISTAGGVRFDALDGTMLKARPGVFVAGEMVDWEAPTGGYLLTACLAGGRAAADDVLRWAQSA